MNANLLDELSIIERDSKTLESIQKLQELFQKVSEKTHKEYQDTLRRLLDQITSKMKKNEKMVKSVDLYVKKYVSENKQSEASNELFDLLAIEFVQNMNVIQNSQCVII